MNKDEYVIVSKTNLLQKIEKLKLDPIFERYRHNNEIHNGHSPQDLRLKAIIEGKIIELENILSNSIELIPEIEKAFDEGSHFKEKWFKEVSLLNSDIIIKEPNVENYINQLKLDI